MVDDDLSREEKQYQTTNQVVRGIADFLEAAKLEDAAKLYSHCAEDIGYVLMAKVKKERPVQVQLARMFFMAKDYEKAALVLEANEEYKRAAELYERTDQYDHAAEMWIRVGDTVRAAHNYEKHGAWQTAADLYTRLKNYERAAYCFEKAVNHFLAGKYYFQLKKYEKSMELLQKVSNEEEEYLDAAIMIGNILAMNGYLDMAVAKYRGVTKSVPISKGSISVYYNLAQLLERQGALFEAIKEYKEVAGIDSGFRDVAARIGELEKNIVDEVEVVEAAGHEELEVLEDLEPLDEEEAPAVPGPHPEVATPKAQIVSVMEGFEFLKNTSLFDRLSLTEMKRMWNICETEKFEPSAILIEQDQPGKALYIVKAGSVVVQRVEGDKVTDLVELKAGAHVGEMSLVDTAPTSARVIAGSGGAESFEITREKFEELLESDDKIAIKVYKVFIGTMCDRLRKTTAELSSLKAEKA
jgi:tetratricopeptide (TPR) repeat protein